MSKISKKIVLKLIKKGNKYGSEKIYLNLLRKLKFEYGVKNPIFLIENVINNISTPVTLVSKKVGGTVYQIPVPVKKDKDISIGVSWLLDYIKSVKDVKMVIKLYNEVLLIKKNEGETLKRKLSLHKLAMNNRAFLKFLG